MLTFSESERLAYVAGDAATAQLCASLLELETDADATEQALKDAEQEAYERGREDAADSVLLAKIKELEADCLFYKTHYQSARDDLEAIALWFKCGELTKAADRKLKSNQLYCSLLRLPRI